MLGSPGHVTLVPIGTNKPRSEVHLVSSNAIFGKDLRVMFEGTLSERGVLENATGIFKKPTALRTRPDLWTKPGSKQGSQLSMSLLNAR